jgi:CheY-like chemotaxis protein
VNAVDAMPDGGVLELSTGRAGNGAIEIRVKDTGKGMTPEQVRRATEPFYTTKPAGKGTGLGLAMVYGTVKAHRGTLEIRSQPGAGTEVILAFPPLEAVPAGSAAPAGPAPEPGPGAARSARRLLLVDDDELIRSALGAMLETMGWEVHAAESGPEALERLQEGLQVELVVLDMNMPGLNGAETLARLRKLRPVQPVLLATGYSDADIGPILAAYPHLGCLHKPFTPEEFRTALEALRIPDAPVC